MASLQSAKDRYAFQSRTVATVNQFLEQRHSPRKLLISSPTGSGKSYMQLACHKPLQSAKRSHGVIRSVLVTPRIEIIADMLRKLGMPSTIDAINRDCNTIDKLVEHAWNEHAITTPIRFKRMLLYGEFGPQNLACVHIDEAHHDLAQTYQDIATLLPDECKIIGWTASPYRGNPKESAEFLAQWGKPLVAISYREAVNIGVITMPTVATIPLVDDDILEVVNGEFSISTVTSATKNKLRDAIDHCRLQRKWWRPSGCPVAPTVIGVPTSGAIHPLLDILEEYGIPANAITDETPYRQRKIAFQQCRESRYTLVHINVVSEGVDLPIRRYLDLAPVLSPVMFMQRFGRAMRPNDGTTGIETEYVCTNRNIERHGYIFDGAMPPAYISQAQLAFPNPSDRQSKRVFGLQSLGKIRGKQIKLTNGLYVTLYCVSEIVGREKQEYSVILHPSYEKPLWFARSSPMNIDGESRDYGTWGVCEQPEKLTGFQSAKPGALTEGQLKWWNNKAESYGLDRQQTEKGPNNFHFQLLPILRDAGAKLS